MSAPNFYSKAGTVYAIEDTEDQYILEDIQENVIESLRAGGLAVESKNESDRERSYPGTSFASVTLKTSRDDVYIEAKLIMRNGYFTGCNLDYDLMVHTAFDGEYTGIDDLDPSVIKEATAQDLKCSPAMFRKYQNQGRVYDYKAPGFYTTYDCYIAPTQKQADKITKQLLIDQATLINAIDAVYSANTMPLRRVATFSNGEAIYEKIEAKS